MNVHHLPARRQAAPRATLRQSIDMAIGVFVLVGGVTAGVLLLCWLVSLPFRHLYLIA